jgi:hypothetical protein
MSASDTSPPPEEFCSLAVLKRRYDEFREAKRDETAEAETARRYYHGDQWTENELKVLEERKQPPITYNRIQRKIDGIVGLVERLRQDPRAYPRTPAQEEGAGIATGILTHLLDANRWATLSAKIARDAAIEPVAGIELSLEAGDHGDPDISLQRIDPTAFFYDPRAVQEDFSDARWLGIAKWVDLDQARDMFADLGDRLDALVAAGAGESGLDGADRERAWVLTNEKRLRIVEQWYRKNGAWRFCFYTGAMKLKEGTSPFMDQRGRSTHRFVVFSANVDHDGDRYGFVRNLKGPQDEVNHRRSKSLHALNTRQIRYTAGTVDDIEAIRREVHRPDGVIAAPPGAEIEILSHAEALQGHFELLAEAKAELDSFGPNPALAGAGSDATSGRAMQVLHRAGIAELGPYLIAYRDWKLQVYRAVWNLVQRAWTEERWIRVTDDEGLARFLELNGLRFDALGRPLLVNALGALDVDIIVDEGQDSINLMEDVFDTLGQLARRGVPVPPDVIVEMSGLAPAVKKRVIAMLAESRRRDPAVAAAGRLTLAGMEAGIDKTRADADRARADALRNTAAARRDLAESEKTRRETLHILEDRLPR